MRSGKQPNDFQSFKTIQKKVKKSIRNAKHNYETMISKSAKTNPKLFYSYLSKKKRNKVQVRPLMGEGGELNHDSKAMAETLNRHYAQKIQIYLQTLQQ